MTKEERSMVFQVLTSINGYGPNKILTTDANKQIKWIDKATLIKEHLPSDLATEAFVKQFSESITYWFGDTFVGNGTKDTPFNVKK